MRRKLIAIALSSLISLSSATLAEPRIEIQGSEYDADLIAQIVTDFLAECPRLKKGVTDIRTIKVKTSSEYAEHRLKRGWKTNIHISIALPDKLDALPAFDDRVGVIAGHTLHYDIGGGKTPGFLGQKLVSHFLCDMKLMQGSDSFKAVPAFASISY